MINKLFPIAVLFIALGCTGGNNKGTPYETDPTPDGDADTDADSDADTDTAHTSTTHTGG